MITLVWIFFIVLILLGVPVAFVIGGSSVIMLLIDGTNISLTIAQKMINGLDSFTLLAIPFFMCAAAMMTETKVSEKIFSFANSMVRHLPGGPAQVNILASIIMAGMSGTAVNDITGIGALEVRAMEKEGYNRPFAGAVTAASSAIGPIIPPSVPLVLIGSIMGVSISKILIAGIVPGLMMGIFLMLLVTYICKKRNYNRLPRVTVKELFFSFLKAIPALLTPVILVGGFMSGFATPTESACVAVVYSMFLGFVFYRNTSFKQFWRVLEKAAILCAITMIIIACSATFGLIITQQQIPQRLAVFVLSLTSNYYVIIFLVIVILLILGSMMETTAIMIIITPILMVVISEIGMDLVQFAILEALVITLGLFTPPVGVGMFLTCKVCHIKTGSFLREIRPFLIIMFICVLLIAYIPALSLWLPDLFLK